MYLVLDFGFGDLLLELYVRGYSLRKIAKIVGKSHMTVYRHLKPVMEKYGIPFRPPHRLKERKTRRRRNAFVRNRLSNGLGA